MYKERKSYKIPQFHMDNFRRYIDDVNRIASRKNLPRINVIYGSNRIVKEIILTITSKGEMRVKKDVRVYDIEIEIVMPEINDWVLISTIDIESHIATIYNKLPESKLPFALDPHELICDHCKTHKHRKYICVLKNSKTQSITKVGRSCLESFLGRNPAILENCVDFASDVFNYIDDHFVDRIRDHVGSSSYLNIYKLLAIVAYCYDRDKQIVSKKTAELNGIKSTAEMAIELYRGTKHESIITEEQNQTAVDAINWIRSASINDNFLESIKDVCQSDYLLPGDVSRAVYLIPKYSEIETHTNQKSDLVGKVGEEITCDLKLVRISVNPSGKVYRYIFVENSKNIVIWKASKSFDLKINKIYRCKFVVIEHRLYKEVKETFVKGLKIIESE